MVRKYMYRASRIMAGFLVLLRHSLVLFTLLKGAIHHDQLEEKRLRENHLQRSPRQ